MRPGLGKGSLVVLDSFPPFFCFYLELKLHLGVCEVLLSFCRRFLRQALPLVRIPPGDKSCRGWSETVRCQDGGQAVARVQGRGRSAQMPPGASGKLSAASAS